MVESTPREGRPSAWTRIVTWVETQHGAPLRREFYAEDAGRRRILTFSDVREVDGRRVPHRWTLVPDGAEGRETRIEIEVIRFDGRFDDAVFTTGHMKPSE